MQALRILSGTGEWKEASARNKIAKHAVQRNERVEKGHRSAGLQYVRLKGASWRQGK